MNIQSTRQIPRGSTAKAKAQEVVHNPAEDSLSAISDKAKLTGTLLGALGGAALGFASGDLWSPAVMASVPVGAASGATVFGGMSYALGTPGSLHRETGALVSGMLGLVSGTMLTVAALQEGGGLGLQVGLALGGGLTGALIGRGIAGAISQGGQEL